MTFDSPGVYEVTVQASDNAGGGGSGSIQITVNSATSQSPGDTNPPAPVTGPQTSHGTQPGGAAGRHQSNASSTAGGERHDGRHRRQQKGPQHGSSGNTAPGSGGASPTSGNSGRSSGSTGTANHEPVDRQRSPPGSRGQRGAERHRPSASTGSSSSAPEVTGRRISDVTLLPAGVSPLVHVVPASLAVAPAARRVIHASVLPALAGALAVVLLFGLGAGWELAGRRGWHALRFGG